MYVSEQLHDLRIYAIPLEEDIRKAIAAVSAMQEDAKQGAGAADGDHKRTTDMMKMLRQRIDTASTNAYVAIRQRHAVYVAECLIVFLKNAYICMMN